MQRPYVGGDTGCSECQHKTKCLNTNQKVYFYITNIFIETIVFIYYTMCMQELGTYTITHLPTFFNTPR